MSNEVMRKEVQEAIDAGERALYSLQEMCIRDRKGIVDYFAAHPQEKKNMTLVAGFKTPNDILFVEDFAKWKKAMDVILTVDCAEGDTSCQIGLVTQYIPQIRLDVVEEACLLYTSRCV